ncbi:MAG: hypothetical protein ACFFBD_16780 [Candidatus Hodarchaeota archaeon]
MLKVKEIEWVNEIEDDLNVPNKRIKTIDETLEILQTIGALVDVLPNQLPIGASISIIFSMFAQKNRSLLLKHPRKMYRIVRQFILDEETRREAILS